MKTIKCGHESIVSFSDKTVNNKKCTATSGMVIVNDDIYCIRSATPDNENKMPVVLHKMFNYLSDGGVEKTVTIHTVAGSTALAIHANSLTYHDHLFYMVTRNGSKNENQILAFNSDGVIEKKYKYTGGKKIATINYYDTFNGSPRFLISVGGGTTVPYRLAKISGSNLDDVAEFSMVIPDATYSTGNDSYYNPKTKQLYVTKMKSDSSIYNRIYQYDLSSGLVNKKKYTANTIYYAHANDESKYEVEGISMYKDKLYVCTNSVINKAQADSVDVLI